MESLNQTTLNTTKIKSTNQVSKALIKNLGNWAVLSFQNKIFDLASVMIEGYTGGLWDTYEIRPIGGVFMVPLTEESKVKVHNPYNYSTEYLSPEAAGICLTLITLSSIAIKLADSEYQETYDKVALAYHGVAEYMHSLDEKNQMMQILD